MTGVRPRVVMWEGLGRRSVARAQKTDVCLALTINSQFTIRPVHTVEAELIGTVGAYFHCQYYH